MIETVIGIFLGAYGLQGTNLILTFLECYICIALFARKLGRQEFFVPRLVITLFEGVILCYLLAIWYTEVNTLPVRIICYLTITALNLGALLFCWQDSVEELLLAFCSGMAAYQFTNKLYPLLQNMRGINDRETLSLVHAGTETLQSWEWGAFFAFYIGMFLLLSFLFEPKNKLVHNKNTTRNVIILSSSTVMLVNVLICISRFYEGESFILNMVTKTLYVASSLMVLLACAGIFSQSERDHQISMLQQLWRQDKAQFESIKANMDVINMKCHDLKHILGKIENKLTEEEAVSLREAIEFYDSNIRTGNEVLDVVLCEKAMTCQKNGVAFSCMADGAKLDFLSPVQVYSLFGNLIDNAVEAVKRLPHQEHKVISLTCQQEGDVLEIEESNYFVGNLTLEGGLPVTGKEDRSRHGFGLKSIKYIAEQYDGTMDIKIVDNMFFLTVRFPLKQRNRQMKSTSTQSPS